MEKRNLVQQTDGSVLIQMYYRSVEDLDKSREAGRPIYVEIPYLEKICDGGKHIVARKVKDSDKQTYPDLWARFSKDGASSTVEGTPLNQFPVLSVELIHTLNGAHIYTLEQLTEIPDTGLQVLGLGGRELRKKAKAYLDVAKKKAKISQFVDLNEQLKRDLDAKQDQINALVAKLEAIEKLRGA